MITFTDFKVQDEDKVLYGVWVSIDNGAIDVSVWDANQFNKILREATRYFPAVRRGGQLFFDSIEDRSRFRLWAELKWT